MEAVHIAWFIFGAIVGVFIGFAVSFVLVVNDYELDEMRDDKNG